MDRQTLAYTVSPIFSEALDAEITLDRIAVERQDSAPIGGGAFCLMDGLLDGDDPDNDAIADFLNDLVGNQASISRNIDADTRLISCTICAY